MGMFDYINCEYKLPIEYRFQDPENFQTKDLIIDMAEYRITRQGILKFRPFLTGTPPFEEISDYHTGWVNMYDHQIIDKHLNAVNGYDKIEARYCLNFNYMVEFYRGELQDIIDKSYAKKREWNEEERCYNIEESYEINELFEILERD